MTRIILLTLFLAALCPAQERRILIVTDLEGVGGVNNADEQLLPGQRRYMESRHLLVGEVNAAVDGAFKAGATEVVVWDGHDGSRTLSIDEIDSRARLLQGRPTPANYYLSEKRYSGIIFVGQHSKAGTKNGVLAHSQNFAVKRIAINGTEVGEVGQVAAIAGFYGIPVIMLAGDKAACTEVQDLQPEAVTVPVKELAGKTSTISLSHEEAKKRINAAAQQAVSNVNSFRPWKLSGPVEMTIEYLPEPPQQPLARTQTFRGQNVLEAYEAWLGK